MRPPKDRPPLLVLEVGDRVQLANAFERFGAIVELDGGQALVAWEAGGASWERKGKLFAAPTEAKIYEIARGLKARACVERI